MVQNATLLRGARVAIAGGGIGGAAAAFALARYGETSLCSSDHQNSAKWALVCRLDRTERGFCRNGVFSTSYCPMDSSRAASYFAMRSPPKPHPHRPGFGLSHPVWRTVLRHASLGPSRNSPPRRRRGRRVPTHRRECL